LLPAACDQRHGFVSGEHERAHAQTEAARQNLRKLLAQRLLRRGQDYYGIHRRLAAVQRHQIDAKRMHGRVADLYGEQPQAFFDFGFARILTCGGSFRRLNKVLAPDVPG